MRRRTFQITCLLLLGIVGTGPAAASARSDTLRILFIGNSYTYFNNLPGMVAGLAEAGKRQPVKTEMVALGGATLQSLWAEGSAVRRIREGRWSWVVLQEQSTLGAMKMVDGVPQVGEPALFHQYARRFDAEIKKAGARTLFYLTWARRGHPEAQALLTSAYQAIAAELGASVAAVGIAWERAQKADSALVLHVADGSHPNPAGTYLAACVFYGALFGTSPEGLPARVMGIGIGEDGGTEARKDPMALATLDPRLARRLQQVAWETVLASER